jgi:predicted RNA binding protein YcfA (HicA-like mRNA interferase family)
VAGRQPRITGDEAIAALRRAGWYVLYQEGSHARLAHPDRAIRVTVPRHAGKILSPKLFKSIAGQAGMSVDEFAELLQ